MSRIGWCLAIASFLLPQPAFAWGNQGHMAVGLIAYDRLMGHSPSTITAIEALIAQHPDHARFDSALAGLEGAERERRLFALIARWPDDVRATPYNHKHWHHQLRVVTGWTLFRDARFGSADRAFRDNLAIARNAAAEPGRRAVALCWLFHIVGDIHRPLHAGQRQDGRFPFSDFAGTKGWVRRSADAAPESFHHFWDTAADAPGDEWAGAATMARDLEADPPPGPTSTGKWLADYRLWVAESEQAAAESAYPEAMEAEAAKHENAGLLPPDYIERSRAVARTRVGEAGARLSDLLAALFPAV